MAAELRHHPAKDQTSYGLAPEDGATPGAPADSIPGLAEDSALGTANDVPGRSASGPLAGRSAPTPVLRRQGVLASAMSQRSEQPDPARRAQDRHGVAAGGGDSGPLPMGEDTTPMSSSPLPAPPIGEVEQAIQQAAKGETNLDTLVSRLVIEQGLATEEEVQHCLAQVQQTRVDDSQRSLVQLLVDNEYVTKRQISRLRQILEAERSGQKIPGYTVLGKLGAGAMAAVYKARQISLDRTVAIKILPKKFSTNPQFIERFYAEGRAAAALNHPNIVQAYDVGKAGELYYFVMEYVEGRTVYDDIVTHKRFGERDAVEIVMQVAEALQHAHAKGLIHRDVKPKNIIITREGVAKLADMGLARAVSDKEMAEAEVGKAFGTPYYISPEQIRGEKNIGPQADIYSLGATLYHMVTGSVPFEGKNPSAVMHKHLKAELVPPDHVNPKLSAGISEVIELMMAKEASRRYQNCRDLLADLRAVREGKHPPLAHKDMMDSAALARLAAVEASATPMGEMPVNTAAGSGSDDGILSQPLFIALLISLGLSVAGNVFLLLTRGG